jgi:hypothetical protein
VKNLPDIISGGMVSGRPHHTRADFDAEFVEMGHQFSF